MVKDTTKKVTFAVYTSSETPDVYYGEKAVEVINDVLTQMFYDIEVYEEYEKYYRSILEDIVDYGYLRGKYALDDDYPDAVFMDIDFDFEVGEVNRSIAKKLLEQIS